MENEFSKETTEREVRFRDLENDVKEIQTESIKDLTVCIKTIETTVKNIGCNITELKQDNKESHKFILEKINQMCTDCTTKHQALNEIIDDHTKSIGKFSGWLAPFGFLWAVMAVIIGWIISRN